MSTRFAGSRSLDERRRRRLAAGGEDPAAPAVTAPAAASLDAGRSRCVPTRFPLRKLVSPRPWKVWLVISSLYLLAAAILAAGATVPRWERYLGPGLAGLFSGGGGRVATLYGTLLLFASSQLALLIWWVRSRSPRDFAGQFRVWGWAAAAFFSAACTLITSAHDAWSETVLWLWRTDFAHHATLAWLTPVVLAGGMLASSLLREISESRSATVLLWLAVGGWLTAAGTEFIPTAAVTAETFVLCRAGATLTGFVSLVSSLAIHAQHVLYCSADPPPVRPSKLRLYVRRLRLPRWRFRLPSFRRTSAATSKGRSDTPALDGADAKEARPARTQAKKETKPAPRRNRRRSESAAEQPADELNAPEELSRKSDEPVSPPEPVSSNGTAPAESIPEPTSAASSKSLKAEPAPTPVEQEAATDEDESVAWEDGSGKQYRVDPPDKSMLKGLSKRERRRLQQQWREQERAARRE